jgi:transcription elongation factor GreB
METPSNYITPEGAQALKAELQQLWREVRPEVVRALAAAAAEGDRSENAEYTYRKKQLGGIDRRIRYLSKRLDVIKVVDRLPADLDTVRFGAWVSLQAPRVPISSYRIVGADETDAEKGWISIDSPVARALLGKRVGDVLEVELPAGPGRFEVLEVSYTRKA